MKSNKVTIILALIIGIIIGAVTIRFFVSSDNETHQRSEAAEHGEQQLYSCGMHPDVISEEPGNCPICGMKLTPISKSGNESANKVDNGKILYWRAPMDPTYISDKPGKSPMGMDLVPVYEGEEGGGSGSILIDPVVVQNMGIKTTEVTTADLSRNIRAVGTVVYNEERLYTVNSKISGWIEKLHINFTGQNVRKGEPLLEIYSPELVSAQEEYLLALNNAALVADSPFEEIRRGAESLLQSARNRLENWDISNADIDRLAQRKTATRTMKLTAPANGTVIHKNAVEGVYVKEGTNLYQIADLSEVWVDVNIYEYELPWIKMGQSAEMALSYLPGKKYSGKVSYVYPTLNQKTRTAQLRLQFPNPDLELKPEMYANITIDALIKSKTLVIPGAAIIRSGVRNVVFVTREQGKFEPREIKIGAEGNNGLVQVLSGLMDGEKIVTSGQFLLDSESNAQEAINKMLTAKKQMTDESNETIATHEHQAEEKTDKIQQSEADTEHQHHGHAALYTCPMHPEFVTNNPDERCPECQMKLKKLKDLEATAQLYTCPMHPEFVTDDPDGRCSICEMKLVKME